ADLLMEIRVVRLVGDEEVHGAGRHRVQDGWRTGWRVVVCGQVIVGPGGSFNEVPVNTDRLKRRRGVNDNRTIITGAAIPVDVVAVYLVGGPRATLEPGYAGERPVAGEDVLEQVGQLITGAKPRDRVEIRDREEVAVIVGRRSPILAAAAGREIGRVGRSIRAQGEDLRPVVEVLAVDIVATNLQAVPQVVGARDLQAVVIGVGAVLAQDDGA